MSYDDLISLLDDEGDVDISQFSFNYIGVTEFDVSSQVPIQHIFFAPYMLQQNVAFSISNAPEGSDVICVTCGDWDSGSDNSLQTGEGQLFVMGIGTGEALELSPVDIVTTSVVDTGDFSEIEYMGIAAAAYITNDSVIPGTKNAFTSIFDRSNSFNGSGGILVFDDFFSLQLLTRNNREFGADFLDQNNPEPHYFKIIITQKISESYTACEADDSKQLSKNILWTVFAPEERSSWSLPTPPSGWPRSSLTGDLAGLIDPGSTVENDVINWEWQTVHEGLNPGFDYDNMKISNYRRYVTHITINNQDF